MTALLGGGIAAAVLAVWLAQPRARSPQASRRSESAALTPSPVPDRDDRLGVVTAEPTATPRRVAVVATWRAPADAATERYSAHAFERLELRYGERLYIDRVCVSDARKITMISYTGVLGNTGATLLLGDRGPGRIDRTDARCTLFDRVEVAKLEQCKCWFQCGGEEHRCEVSGSVGRP